MKTKDLINTKIILSKTPRGKLEESDFEIINEKVPKLKKNQMLIKNGYLEKMCIENSYRDVLRKAVGA